VKEVNCEAREAALGYGDSQKKHPGAQRWEY